MKTLAQMTEKERAECCGMWHDTIFGLVILEKLQEDPEEGDPFGLFRHPRTGAWHTEDFTGVTPRFDLPRAWTPDGTPPAGEWQTAKMKIIPNENAKYDPDRGVITGDAVADPDHEPRDSHDIRRWISDWEAMEWLPTKHSKS